MGKKKKTKKEKVISDLRRKLSLEEKGSIREKPFPSPSLSPDVKIPLVTASTKAESALNRSLNDYTHLAGDLKKAGILTGLALSVQFVLYLILH